MNYLAHILLSGDDPLMRLGGFMADAVKGSAYDRYPRPVADGILLHREVDAYTDSHPDIKEMVRELRPQFGRYSGVVADILLDHALARDFGLYSDVSLRKFSRGFYLSMIRYKSYLPERIRRFMWHFISTDRLGKYASVDGIADSLSIMVRYRHLDIHVDAATEYLIANKEAVGRTFAQLFADLSPLCSMWIGGRRSAFSHGRDVGESGTDETRQIVGRDQYL